MCMIKEGGANQRREIGSSDRTRLIAKTESIGCKSKSIEALHLSGTLVEPPALMRELPWWEPIRGQMRH